MLKLKQIVNTLTTPDVDQTSQEQLKEILTSIPAVSGQYEKGRKDALKASKKTVAEGKARKIELWVDQEGISIYNKVVEVAAGLGPEDEPNGLFAEGKERKS